MHAFKVYLFVCLLNDTFKNIVHSEDRLKFLVMDLVPRLTDSSWKRSDYALITLQLY